VGIKLTDPRRMAVYFAKYGTGGRKDYQHRVPPEWLSITLVCEDCGAEYHADRDECPDCGCLDAELVETGTGPGRFWGYRALTPVLAARQVTPDIGIAAGRVLRRWYRAKGLTKTVLVERVEQATGRVRVRRTRKRRRLFVHGRGFACVNDGPAFTSRLARHLVALPGGSGCGRVFEREGEPHPIRREPVEVQPPEVAPLIGPMRRAASQRPGYPSQQRRRNVLAARVRA
jgi:hypothetical protein